MARESGPSFPSDEAHYDQKPSGSLSERLKVAEYDAQRAFHEYIQAVHGREDRSPECQVLQKVADEMTAKKGFQVKVYVMPRGMELSAFVTRDHSVYISRSLLQRCANVDEAGLIVAHEINHVLNKTFLDVDRADSFQQMSVSALHEVAADLVIDLMKEAKLNSLIAQQVWKKIPNQRSSSHEGSTLRHVMGLGTHTKIFTPTSEQAATPLPESLFHQPLVPTTLEELKQGLQTHEGLAPERENELLRGLHLRELKNIVFTTYNLEVHDRVIRDRVEEKAQAVLIEKMGETGLSALEARALLLFGTRWSVCVLSKDFDEAAALLLQVEALQERTAGLNGKEQSLYEQAYRVLFGSRPDTTVGGGLSSYWRNYASSLERSCATSPQNFTIPNILELCVQFRKAEPYSTHEALGYFARILITMLEKKLEPHADDVPAFEKEIQAFLAPILSSEDGRELLYYLKDGLESIVERVQSEWLSSMYAQLYPKEEAPVEAQEEPFEPKKELQRILQEFSEELVDAPEGLSESHLVGSLSWFVRLTRGKLFDPDHLGGAERAAFLRECFATMAPFFRKKLVFHSYPLQDLEHISSKRREVTRHSFFPTVTRSNKECFFRIKLMMTTHFFAEDTPEFYEMLREIEAEYRQSGEEVTPEYQEHLALGLLSLPFADELDWLKIRLNLTDPAVVIRNIEQLCQQEHVAAFLQKYEQPRSFASVRELIQFTQKNFDSDQDGILFGDSPLALIYGALIRRELQRLIDAGLAPQDLPLLDKFLDKHLPYDRGIQRVSTQMEWLVLQSQPTLDEKMKYALERFSTLGIAGIQSVAGDAHERPEYASLRKQLLEAAKKKIAEPGIEVAGAHFLREFFSHFANDPLALISTADRRNAEKDTNDLMLRWAKYYFAESRNGYGKVIYVPGENVFYAEQLSSFLTVKDIISELKNMPLAAREYLLLRQLTEKNGILERPEGRRKLAEYVADSLDFSLGFASDVIRTFITEASSELVASVLSKALAPLLFESFSLDAIEYDSLRNTIQVPSYGPESEERHWEMTPQDEWYIWHKDYDPSSYEDESRDRDSRDRVKREEEKTEIALRAIISSEEMRQVCTATAREVCLQGPAYRHYPSAPLSRLAHESRETYHHILQSLEAQFLPSESEKKVSLEELTPTQRRVEAGMRMVEAIGSFAIRGTQLAEQNIPFSEPVHERLAQSQDSNTGLEPLDFWENLERYIEHDPELGRFLDSHRFRLGKYLGGGSLYTTYNGWITNDLGAEEEIVIKLLNPNAYGLLHTYNSTALSVFESVEQQGNSPESVQYAKVAQHNTSFAQQWCIADMNDQQFLEHNGQFSEVVEKYHSQSGTQFTTPQIRYHARYVTIETRAAGVTLNQWLQSEAATQQQKHAVLQEVQQFLQHNLQTSQADGFSYVHPDPHPGNFMVSFEDDQLKIAVIDTKMILRLETEKLAPFIAFLRGEKLGLGFLQGYLRHLLHENRVSGLKLGAETARILTEMVAIRSQSLEPLQVLQKLTEILERRHYTTPLWMTLMLRNGNMMQELLRRY